MKSIYNDGSAQLIARVESLNANSPALWGKMNVAQAMAHTAYSFDVAFGNVASQSMLLGRLIGWMFRRLVLRDAPFRKNAPTGPDFIVKDDRDFATESARLIAQLERIGAGGPSSIKIEAHPLLGKMSPADWGTLLTKHTDHHLRQFGA
jgi:hypothetical protein